MGLEFVRGCGKGSTRQEATHLTLQPLYLSTRKLLGAAVIDAIVLGPGLWSPVDG